MSDTSQTDIPTDEKFGKKIRKHIGWMIALVVLAAFLTSGTSHLMEMTTLIKTAVPGSIPIANIDIILTSVLSGVGIIAALSWGGAAALLGRILYLIYLSVIDVGLYFEAKKPSS